MHKSALTCWLLLGACNGEPTNPPPNDDQQVNDTLQKLGCTDEKCDGLFDLVFLNKCEHAQRDVLKATLDPIDKSTTVTASYITDRSLSDLKAIFDPQNWDQCAGTFKSTSLVDGLKPVGSAYSGKLDEVVSLSNFLFDYSRMRNILNVSTQRDATRYELAFSLDRNEGITKVEPLPDGRFRVTGTKRVHFVGTGAAVMNRVAPVLFRRMMESFAQDMLCCTVKK